jgi:hypothetical protein
MATLKNNSQRVVHIDGAMLVPGVETQVPDDVMDRKSVKALVDSKELEVVKGADKAPQPAVKA